MRISFIVPAFNAAARIATALRSVAGRADVEVIVVDDGSSDDTAAVAAAFPGVTVIRTENGGVSAARNVGIQAASGDYIALLDDDDWIDSQALDAVLSRAVEWEAADIVVLRSLVGEHENYPWGGLFPADQTHSKAELLAQGYLRGSSCGCLFRTQFLREQQIRFAEGLRICEDTVFFAESLSHARSIRFFDAPFYRIELREGSASRAFSPREIKEYGKALAAAGAHVPDPAVRDLARFKILVILTARAISQGIGPAQVLQECALEAYLPLAVPKGAVEGWKLKLLNRSYRWFYRAVAWREKLRAVRG